MESLPQPDSSGFIEEDKLALEGLVDIMFAESDAKIFETLNEIRKKITNG